MYWDWGKLKKMQKIEMAVRSDVGLVRSDNQDAYGHFGGDASDGSAPQLFVVADGMGGHARGAEASRTAVGVVGEVFASRTDLPVPQRLERALHAANERIFAGSRQGERRERSGTTCTALAWADRQVCLAHVGDSRAYRIRRDGIELLTLLHTWAAEMYREGILTAEEARIHPRRNTLTQAIGTHSQVTVNMVSVGTPAAGDVFLLCTDGLATVAEPEIHRVVRHYALDDACDRLVRMANDGGGLDNVTVMLIRFG